MKSKNSLTQNSLYYLIYNALNVLFPFLTGIYVARVLLPDMIGLVEKARNLVQYFVIFSFLGIPTYGLKEISKYRNDKKMLCNTYSELILINAVSTSLCLIFYLILIFSLPRLYENIKLYIIVGLLIFLNYFNNSWLYEGLEDFKYISIRNLIFKVVSFGILVLFVKAPEDYLLYASITVIGTAGNYFLNIINAKKYVKFKLTELNIKQHLKPILYLVVVNLAIEIYSLIDITMLGFLKDNKTVAYYSYGIKIYRILLQIVNTFTIVVVPRISLFYKEGKTNEFNNLLTKILKVIIIISLPMIIGINFTSKYLITKIYGEMYIRSSNVLNIVSVILLISPVGYLLGSRVLLVTNNENNMIIPVVAGAITNIILNYFLINRFQEAGAAVASVIGEFVVMIMYLMLGHKYYKLNSIKEDLLKIIYANLIMIIYLIISSNLNMSQLIITMVQISGASILYVSLLYLLHERFVYEMVNENIINRIKNKIEND